MIFTDVQLFKALSVSGGALQYEDDLHKPLLTSGDLTKICSGQEAMAAIAGPVVPKNGQEFREMTVNPGKQMDLLSPPHFLRADTSVGTVYGWIDRVTPLHESDMQRSYRLEWHPDWWLTAQSLSKLGFGQGRVLKAGPEGARPSAVEPRKWAYSGDFVTINKTWPDFQNSIWAIMARIIHVGNTGTQIEYDYWPLQGSLPGVASTPKLHQILEGRLDEMVGGNPEDILGCWISPIPPYSKVNSSFANFGSGDIKYGYAYAVNPAAGIFVSHNPLDHEIQTDDRKKAVFIDCSRTTIFTAPWGIAFREVDAWIDFGTSAAYLNIYLSPIQGTIESGKDQEGRLFSTPLPTLPITGNAWSSYVYSGQREYDIKSREIQRNENAANGISGMATSAIGGAIAGSMVAPGPGTIAGLIGGAAASGISTGISFLTAGEADGRAQRAADKLKSNQSAGMILAAGGAASIIHPLSASGVPKWCGITMQRDPVSLAELDTAQTELGYDTDFYASDCTNLIRAGGPLQISGLQVITDLPNDAKTYIAAIFQRGVYIDAV